MSERPCRMALPLTLALLAPGLAFAQKLDKEERKWLDDVRPLMLPDEEKTFKGLKDKADRQEFQKLFWARRDPDLATPENEALAEYEALRAEADLKFRVPGMAGSLTDCGRTLILLGKPNEVQQESSEGVGLRVPETWTYRGEAFQGGKAMVSFDAECRAPGGFSTQLDRVAAAKVVQPNIDYRRGKDGKLVKLQDQLPRDTAARALLKQPREDFPLAVQTMYLKVADGGTALLGFVRGDSSGLATAGSGEGKTVHVSIAASALAADGKEAGWTEQTMTVPVAADGSFVASFKLGLKPGPYTLRSGVVDVKGGKASLATTSVEVPDLSLAATAADGTVTKTPSTSSVIVVRSIETLPAGGSDPSHPLAAFELGGVRLVPLFGGVARQADQVEFFYQVYDLTLDPATGKADATAVVSILKDGKKPVAKAPANEIHSAFAGSSVGPVPLAGFEPGKYVVQLKVTDKVGKKDLVQETALEVLP